jgi:hypothetical protein
METPGAAEKPPALVGEFLSGGSNLPALSLPSDGFPELTTHWFRLIARETCIYPKPEGGVWRCEEYR